MSGYQRGNMDFGGEQSFLNLEAKVPTGVLGMELEPLMTERDIYDFESLIFQTVVNEGKHLSVCGIFEDSNYIIITPMTLFSFHSF